MIGIEAVGSYIPRYRLDRDVAGIGRGARAVASFDEDATSMGVEAARRALDEEGKARLDTVLFATTNPPYADRTNANAIHQALDLGVGVAAFDAVGSLRSTIGVLRAATDAAAAGRTTLVVASDVRVGLPGSSDERDGGDAAVALMVSPSGDAGLELVGTGSASGEFLDRWRVPGEASARVWEERFGETEYLPLAETAFAACLKAADVEAEDIDHLIVTGLHVRAVGVARKRLAVRPDSVVDDLVGSLGITGSAHPALLLADVAGRAEPGQLIALLVLADGADCLLFRCGSGVASISRGPTVAAQTPGAWVDYTDMLVWRGLLRRDPPRRPEPDRPAAPPSSRNAAWKFGLVGSRCHACGTRHLPPERVCLSCRASNQMDREPLADVQGTISTFAIDHLAYTLAPPVVAAVIDLDGGGRIQCEVADADPSSVAIGQRVEMTFRRLYTTADGVHNYFWKARPLEGGR